MRKATLIGGTNHGMGVVTPWWQKSYSAAKCISLEEFRGLNIDDCVAWKAPEEVYNLTSDTEFTYSHTINYKPDGGEESKQVDCVGFYPVDDYSSEQCDHEEVKGECTFFINTPLCPYI